MMKGFSETTSGFTLNVKAFRKMTSPFTLNGEGISEKAFTLDVKTYSPIHQIFFPQLAKQQPERREHPGGRQK
ncbi:hypothetical protein [Clostridium sp. chh4-2]|uniref:hypothetical protein n=1 Tax=Clostridium sp. chh4-2 TaxID=2067550 RepID=UPI0015E1B81C|nr:hypothetical protein [Clostridium sp. chh4-2]